MVHPIIKYQYVSSVWDPHTIYTKHSETYKEEQPDFVLTNIQDLSNLLASLNLLTLQSRRKKTEIAL